MSRKVDLRSDTVTQPTPEMFEAMARAPLGDDVLGDDPTVHELESEAAARTGHEAAVFVPSGSMGNQIALAVHCRPGDSILFEEEAHVMFYEAGAPAVIAQAITRQVPSSEGIMDAAEIEKRILKRSLHTPGTAVLAVENTHNRKGGAVTPVERMREFRTLCDQYGLKFHLDGARVFNAATALGVDVRELTSQVDSVSFCLSKGLGSPVGSVLCGSSELIEAARFWRKRLGGGMRQAGLLAACGLVSLRTMVPRLAEDHRRAAELAQAVESVDGLAMAYPCPTNILIIETEAPATKWVETLQERGILCMAFGPNRLRMVVHHQVDDAGIARTIEALRAGLGSPAS